MVVKMISKEQLRILKELDVDAALKNVAQKGFIPDTKEIALAGLHKAHLTANKYFTKDEINKSKEWLTDNGYSYERSY